MLSLVPVYVYVYALRMFDVMCRWEVRTYEGELPATRLPTLVEILHLLTHILTIRLYLYSRITFIHVTLVPVISLVTSVLATVVVYDRRDEY